MNTITRRNFLKAAAASAAIPALAAHAAPPIKRKGDPNLRLSLAAYSFRKFFKHSNRGKPSIDPSDPNAIDMFDFIDFCADHRCDGTELTSYFFPKDVDNDYLLKIRRHAYLRGIPISGTAVGNNFALPKGEARDRQIADVKKWVDHAAVMGAPHIRVFAGAAKGIDDATARKMCISALEECCEYAGSKGIFLGIENHGGIVAQPEGLVEIVKAVQSPWFGVNLDTGNFHTDDPYAALEMCAPWAVNVQVKVDMRAKGKPSEPADLDRIAEMLRKVNYQGYVVLEYEAKEDARKAVPGYLEKLRAVCEA